MSYFNLILNGEFKKAYESLADKTLGALTGTPKFMAPEIWEKGKYSPQSDVYALGMTLFILATGKHPFNFKPCDGIATCAYAHRYADRPDPREFNEQLDELAGVISTAICADEKKRFRDMIEFSEALGAARQKASSGQVFGSAYVRAILGSPHTVSKCE